MKKTAIMLLAALMSVSGYCQKIKGSDTVLPLSQREAEAYSAKGGKVSVNGGGSGVGISALISGSCDIAQSSRKMKFSEKKKLQQAGKQAKEVIIAYDAIAVIVNPANKVSKLTRSQLEQIYTGKITNWKQVGGEDMKIVVYSRETSSGTYEFFKESVMKNKNVKALQVSYDGKNFVAPSVATAKNKTYPIVRPLMYYYEIKSEKKVRPFIDFVLSAEGQKIVSKVGYIPIK